MEQVYTPKVCRPAAQGCRNAATLGSWGIMLFNPNGVVPAGAATPLGLLVFVIVDPG
ncbi:MAG: hypothetical protein AAB363_08880 [Planctomycetota bacterium]